MLRTLVAGYAKGPARNVLGGSEGSRAKHWREVLPVILPWRLGGDCRPTNNYWANSIVQLIDILAPIFLGKVSQLFRNML
jgi:hypothetical protein